MERTDEKPLRARAVGPLGEAAAYAGAFLLALLLFLALKPYFQVSGTRGAAGHILIALSLGGCVMVGGSWALKGKLTPKRLIILFLVAGFALRAGYMLSTPASWRQHDLYLGRSYGHEGYAWGIFSTGKLPATNENQLYHPPLNALLQAGFMHFMSGLERGLASLFRLGDRFTSDFLYGKPDGMADERYALYSSCQILSVLWSFAASVISVKLLALFGVRGRSLAALSAFVIFYPRGIHFAAALNNDGVSYLCSIAALYFAVKWWKGSKKLPDILLCGLFTGLGMMGKLSSATICLPIAGIFVLEFVRTLKKRENSLLIKDMVLQYALFLLICAPVGLWFQIYAKVRFDQPFGHVFSNLRGDLSTADRSLFARFFPVAFDLHEYFDSLWCHTISNESMPNNYNLFHFALRSSIFGEQSYSAGEGFAACAVLFAYLSLFLLFLSAVRAVFLFRRDRK